MKLSLSVGFNDGQQFTHNYIKIDDVAIVPVEGQSVHFNWSDFIMNEELCVKLEEFEDNDMFLAHIGGIQYFKEEVITHISLLAQGDYARCYGKPKG